jgi:coenzyme PQQ synthesis protein D (PqqD)
MSETISKSSTISAAPGQVSSTVEGEAVILNVETGIYYGLNPVGAWVWESIQSPTTVAALLDGLVAEFDVEEDRGESDLMALLDDLAGVSLIEVRE